MAIRSGTRVLTLAAALVAVGLTALSIGAAAGGADEPDPDRFTTVVDNPYLPFVPGTVMTYQETTPEGTGRDVVRVTHRTKLIQGVRTVVVRDKAYFEGELVEDTFDWYAQDDQGNVWYFGEDTKEYENGRVVSTEGSWIAGADGARAGIVMRARPQVGQTYYQEYAPGVAEDEATVLSLDEAATVPFGDFTGVVKTRDFTALDRTVVEHKYYGRGVGLILATKVKGGGERLVLVSVQQADDDDHDDDENDHDRNGD